jgi:preprotein translocase subunit SecA
MARIRFARRAAQKARDDAGRPSGEAAVLAFCLETVRAVSALEPDALACTDGELRARTGAYRKRLEEGEADASLLPEAFATVREAARRAIGLRHHDVQIMGGAALQLGMIAEMRTGEGKTLTATLPAYLAALSGQPVHVMTANDYLATRDRNWMQPVYEFLGLTAGLLEPAAKPDVAVRRPQYAFDVTYGPWTEFCYDFLRDNYALDHDGISQRGLGVAIVDEADLILVDEMRTPAMLSATVAAKEDRHEAVAAAARALQPDLHFTVDEAARTASLTEAGLAAVEDWFGIENLYDATHGQLAYLVENAVSALAYQRDRDYLVADDQVTLIDQKSGRPTPSRLADGMHEALEAKEGLPVQPMRQTSATVTLREYLRQYQHLTGMTGTAASEAPIYRDLYELEVVTIPTNRPVIRIDRPDLLYRTRQAKLAALAADAGRRAAAGQPVLIGAMSDADAQDVAALLTDAGTSCEVLAARNVEREALVLAEAGRPGAVTIVVKMAGRGVDIILGGSSGADHDAVADNGGLCVLGTERTGDRRTELHLRGRAGRQGDPGESLFYLSTEDQVVANLMKRAPKSLLTDGVPFGMLSRQLDKAQINGAAARAQWYLDNVAYDDVLAAQQRAFYADRRSILDEPDMRARIASILDDVMTAEVEGALRSGSGPTALVRALGRLYPIVSAPAYIRIAMQGGNRDPAPVLAAVRRDAKQAHENRAVQLGEPLMRDLERRVLLTESDRAWREHLAAMSDLLSGLRIRGSRGAQALAEYQRGAAELYTAMAAQIKRDSVRQIFFTKPRLPRTQG